MQTLDQAQVKLLRRLSPLLVLQSHEHMLQHKVVSLSPGQLPVSLSRDDAVVYSTHHQMFAEFSAEGAITVSHYLLGIAIALEPNARY
eukprot:845800-Amphidinium_carterae.1